MSRLEIHELPGDPAWTRQLHAALVACPAPAILWYLDGPAKRLISPSVLYDPQCPVGAWLRRFGRALVEGAAHGE